jgi:hypothetical protein
MGGNRGRDNGQQGKRVEDGKGDGNGEGVKTRMRNARRTETGNGTIREWE